MTLCHNDDVCHIDDMTFGVILTKCAIMTSNVLADDWRYGGVFHVIVTKCVLTTYVIPTCA